MVMVMTRLSCVRAEDKVGGAPDCSFVRDECLPQQILSTERCEANRCLSPNLGDRDTVIMLDGLE